MLSTFFVGSTCHSRSLETQYTDTPLYKVKWKTGLKKPPDRTQGTHFGFSTPMALNELNPVLEDKHLLTWLGHKISWKDERNRKSDSVEGQPLSVPSLSYSCHVYGRKENWNCLRF